MNMNLPVKTSAANHGDHDRAAPRPPRTDAKCLPPSVSLRLQKIALNAAMACFVWLSLSSPALAQALPDPTRPPAGFVDPADAKAGGSGGQGRAGAINGGAGPESPGLVLQSVLLPRNGTPVAVISGKYLPLGARIDQWELNAVSEREAVLIQGAQRRVLKLTPQASKTLVQPIPSASPKQPVRARSAKSAQVKESESKR